MTEALSFDRQANPNIRMGAVLYGEAHGRIDPAYAVGFSFASVSCVVGRELVNVTRGE